jgi:hypothetical protein
MCIYRLLCVYIDVYVCVYIKCRFPVPYRDPNGEHPKILQNLLNAVTNMDGSLGC